LALTTLPECVACRSISTNQTLASVSATPHAGLTSDALAKYTTPDEAAFIRQKVSCTSRRCEVAGEIQVMEIFETLISNEAPSPSSIGQEINCSSRVGVWRRFFPNRVQHWQDHMIFADENDGILGRFISVKLSMTNFAALSMLSKCCGAMTFLQSTCTVLVCIPSYEPLLSMRWIDQFTFSGG
jgi:hypothetical protein